MDRHEREDDLVLGTIPWIAPAPEVARDGPEAACATPYGLVLAVARQAGMLDFYAALFDRDWDDVIGFLAE